MTHHGAAATGQQDAADDETQRQKEIDARLLDGLRDGKWLDGATFKPLQFAVPGLVPEGSGILIAPPKAGKSWLALDFLLAVASEGGRALGTIPTGSARDVLYLALEDGDRRMQSRCRVLLGDGDAIPPKFHYKTRIEAGMVIVTIEAFLRACPDTALVVIDTLGKVMPAAIAGESAYQRDYRIGGALKTIADNHPGLALLVIHHDRKAMSDDFVDSVSGTHGIAGAADTIIVLSRPRNSNEGLLKITGRDIEENEFAIYMADGSWNLHGKTLDEAADYAAQQHDTENLGDRSKDVIDYVNKHPDGVKGADVERDLNLGPKQGGTYLSRLFNAGKIRKLSRGLYVPLSQSGVGTVGSVGADHSNTGTSNTSNSSNSGRGWAGDGSPSLQLVPDLSSDPDNEIEDL